MAGKTKQPAAAVEEKSWIKRSKRSMIWVTLDDAQKKQVRLAAAEAGIPMSQFAQKALLDAAENILGKSGK